MPTLNLEPDDFDEFASPESQPTTPGPQPAQFASPSQLDPDDPANRELDPEEFGPGGPLTSREAGSLEGFGETGIGRALGDSPTANRLFDIPGVGELGQFAGGVAQSLPARALIPGDFVERFGRDLANVTKRGRPLEGFLEGAGEIVPEMAAFGGAFAGGRALSLKAAQAAADAGKLAKIPGMGKATLKLLEGPLSLQAKQPLSLKAIEIAGGGIGTGLLDGMDSLAQGRGIEEALGDAATTAILVGAGEVGVRTIGRALGGKRAKDVDQQDIIDVWESAGVQKVVKAERRGINKAAKKASEDLDEALQAQQQAQALKDAFEDVGSSPVFGSLSTDLESLAPKKLAKQAFNAARKVPKAQQRAAKATSNKEVFEKRVADIKASPFTINYLLGDPDVPIGSTRKLMRGLLGTPEGEAGRFSAVGAKLMRAMDDADIESIMATTEMTVLHARWEQRAWAAMGKKGKPKNGKFFAEVADVYEQGGDVRALARAKGWNADEIGSVMDDMAAEWRLFDELVKHGAERPLLQAELDAMVRPGGRYVPQVVRRLDDAKTKIQSIKQIAHDRGVSQNEAAELYGKMIENMQKGPRKFGSIDFQRKVKGTTREKLANEMSLVEDPFEASFIYMSNLHRRLAISQKVGFRGELIERFVRMESAAGGDGDFLRQMAHTVGGFNYYDAWKTRLADHITNTEAALKLPFAVFYNAMQPMANNPLFFGWKNSNAAYWRAVRTATTGRERDSILMRASALMDNLLEGSRRNHMGVTPDMQTTASRIAGMVLNGSQFNRVEAWNRYQTAVATGLFIQETLAKAATGRLRGKSLDMARRKLADVGLDLRAIARAEYHLPEDEYMRAIFRGVSRTQFLPSKAQRPILWESPLGRVMAQFGTFQLNQGRLIKDSVFAEAARGNFGPLGYVLAIHPVLGEAANDVVALLKGRERTDNFASRMVEDYASVGNLGVGQMIYYNLLFGKVPGSGPFFADLADAGSGIAKGVTTGDFNHLGRFIKKQPLAQVPGALLRGGAIGIEAYQAIGNLLLDGEESPEEGASLHDVFLLESSKKNRLVLDDEPGFGKPPEPPEFADVDASPRSPK